MRNRIRINEVEAGTASMLALPQIPRRIKPLLPWRVFYRCRQFFQGVGASVSPEEMLIAARNLPRPALALFCQMPLDAQRHSFNVLYTLESSGCVDPDLKAAALLHDVGKIAVAEANIQLTPWLRIPLVLMSAVAPSWLERQASQSPEGGWRFLVYVHQEHAHIGAERAREARCSERTCWLIDHHQDPPLLDEEGNDDKRLLRLLQWADHRN